MQRSISRFSVYTIIIFLAYQYLFVGCLAREFESGETNLFQQQIAAEGVDEDCGEGPDEMPTDITSEVIYSQTPDSDSNFNMAELQTVTPTSIDYTSLEPAGCRIPGENYELVIGDYWKLNMRTFQMLEYAMELYKGEIDITRHAITQGSYSNSEKASFGTHSGGGAVDLSVMREGTYTVLYNEIYPLIMALRTAGFGAWFRDFDELYDGSPVHIHAVAIGDDQLSQSAKEQLDGEYGYFLGYSGLPTSNGYPSEDRYGGPIYCNWMSEMGYQDVFAAPVRSIGPDWDEKIKEVYKSYTTLSWEETIEQAQSKLNLFYDYSQLNYSGHLIKTIIEELDLIPRDLSPNYRGIAIWKPTDKNNPDSFSFFTHQDYELFEFDIPIAQFGFYTWRLFPGDILYVYRSSSISSVNVSLFLITEVDERGVVYGIGVKDRVDGQFIVERLLLYDPLDMNSGVFSENSLEHTDLELGINSIFDVLRLRRFITDPDRPYGYIVRPGDTIITIANEFHVSVEAIVQINRMVNIEQMEVGQQIIIPIGF